MDEKIGARTPEIHLGVSYLSKSLEELEERLLLLSTRLNPVIRQEPEKAIEVSPSHRESTTELGRSLEDIEYKINIISDKVTKLLGLIEL